MRREARALRLAEAIEEAQRLTGVPIRVVDTAALPGDMRLDGGVRLEGLAGGIRQRCTAGFVVTDGQRSAISTAAHCPDELSYREADGTTVADLVAARAQEHRRVAVAVNGDVVPRSAWSSTGLQDGDAVEVLVAVAGG